MNSFTRNMRVAPSAGMICPAPAIRRLHPRIGLRLVL